MNYVVDGDEMIIVDEFTGRKMPGRQWSDGLHQAVEAKEGVRIKEETQTYATITLQNYFKLYDKISGMTGTAMTEAVRVLEDLQARRDRHSHQPARSRASINPDVIYRTEREKYDSHHRRDRAASTAGTPSPRPTAKPTPARSPRTSPTRVEIQLRESKKLEQRSHATRSSRSTCTAGRSWSAPCRSKRASG